MFRALPATEYLKQQASFSKAFNAQLKKTFETLRRAEQKEDDCSVPKPPISLSSPIKSESASSFPETRNRQSLIAHQSYNLHQQIQEQLARHDGGFF